MIAFGPVPSRRLGHSLGINNIPAKICSYACVYCQLGNTIKMQVKRQGFYPPERLYEEISEKVQEAKSRGEKIDYLTFVPDGEPTLDLNLGKEIGMLRSLGIPVAVITNSSLIDIQDVRRDLLGADWVSLKVDAVSEDIWHRVDRPHGSLDLESLHQGMLRFASEFKGFLATETMLVDGVNDSEEELELVAGFLKKLNPSKAYISIPTRPPAEGWVNPASTEAIAIAYHLFCEALGEDRVEHLIGYEGNEFAFTGNVEDDLLSITAVHPMRKDAVEEFLKKARADWERVDRLVESGKMVRLEYRERVFYVRNLPTRRRKERVTASPS